MKIRPARYFWHYGLFLFLGFGSGCFTEVGNPKEPTQVSARFRLDYGVPVSAQAKADMIASGLVLTDFHLGLLEVEYITPDSMEHHLWGDDSTSLPIDFSGFHGLDSLPTQTIPFQNWQRVELECHTPAPADSAGPDPRFVHGYLNQGPDSLPFLFQVPAIQEMNLIYGIARINAWKQGNVLKFDIAFSVPLWTQGVDWSQAQTTPDSLGSPVLLLDSLHNSGIYAQLKQNYLKAFNSDTLYLGVE